MRTTDGAAFTDRRQCAKGDPEDPLTRAEIADKLRIAAADVLPEAQASRIIALIERLEELGDVRELAAALGRPYRDFAELLEGAPEVREAAAISAPAAAVALLAASSA